MELKGSVWLDMVAELSMQYCREMFRIHLKGVFAKNGRVYRLTSKNIRW